MVWWDGQSDDGRWQVAWFGAMLRGSVNGLVRMGWSGTAVLLPVLLVLFLEALVFAGPSVAGAIGCYGALDSRSMVLTEPFACGFADSLSL